jgi:hypothetical protein
VLPNQRDGWKCRYQNNDERLAPRGTFPPDKPTKQNSQTMASKKKLQLALKKLGWRVIVIWECEMEKNVERISQQLDSVFVKTL